MEFICKKCGGRGEASSFEEIVANGKVCDSCRFKSLKKQTIKKKKRQIVSRFFCELCNNVTSFMPYNHQCDCGGHVFKNNNKETKC